MSDHARIAAVFRSKSHHFSKEKQERITLLKGLGVEGDCHAGKTVQHLSRVKVDPTQPNLRQVHLLELERLQALEAHGFHISPGDLGENITTVGIDLHALSEGWVLSIGKTVRVEITGLRNPCKQIDTFKNGLLPHMFERGDGEVLLRRAGIMGVVCDGGDVHLDDPIKIMKSGVKFKPLERV